MLMILLAGCGGKSGAGLEGGNSVTEIQTVHGSGLLQEQPEIGDAGQTAEEPLSMEALEGFLQAELARLEMQRSASAAPGADSAVFSLTAERISEPSEQQNRVELRWTKHLPGDYDGNGEVNAADLVPLGQRWGRQVSYLPEAQSGIAHYPAGDRHDGALGQQNWLASYVDGNHDGEVGIADVTVIAQHWRQRYTGYRIHRRNLELGNGVLLPMPDVEDSPISVSREADDPLLREYVYVDMLDIPGSYEYSVRAWDEFTDTESPAGNAAGYHVNALPQPVISHEVLNESEPYIVQFDGSASLDPDGTIVSYEWDLDGNGEFEISGQETVVSTQLPGGQALIGLRLTDADGAQAQTSLQISLESQLQLVLEATPTEGVAPLQYSLQPVVEGSLPALQYEWFVNADIAPRLISQQPDPYVLQVTLPELTHVRLRVLGSDEIYREADVQLNTHLPLSLDVSVQDPQQFLPAVFELSLDGYTGADPQFELLVDGNESGIAPDAQPNHWTYFSNNPGSHTLQLRATDRFGNVQVSAPQVVTAYRRPEFEFSYSPGIGFSPYTVDWELSSLMDPDNAIEKIRLKFPKVGYLEDESAAERSGSTEVTGSNPTEILIHTIYKGSLGSLAETHPLEFAKVYIDFETDPPVHFGSSLECEIEVTEYSGEPLLSFLEWELDDVFLNQHRNDFQWTTEALGPGSHTLRMYAGNDLGYVSLEKQINVYAGDIDVAIIRNDGGTYQANLDAITSDLDDLGVSWQLFPYNDSILDDLAPHGHFVVLWYRGGPADAIEPRQETMWTTAEIDNYIAILEQGRPMLMMSQNNSKVNDHANQSLFGGWDHYYGVEQLAFTVADTELRHPWASGLRTDDGTGLGAGLFFRSSPLSFNAAFGGLHPGLGYMNSGENFTGNESSASRPGNVTMQDGLQYMGVGGYDDGFLSLNDLAYGLSPNDEVDGQYALGHLSWGTPSAPYRDIGMWPWNWQDHGSTRHWVVGYPWAAATVTDPPGMTRADMLLNIYAWLKLDYEPLF
ncbi:PKD domain-containing protein [bacterium]|nr:PKD domain-containing protein [bacterium]